MHAHVCAPYERPTTSEFVRAVSMGVGGGGRGKYAYRLSRFYLVSGPKWLNLRIVRVRDTCMYRADHEV